MSRPINEILKEARDKAGLDLETVSKETFIPIKFLQHLENGQWQASPVHRTGFLKKYFAYFKIPSDILFEYPEFCTVAESVENRKIEQPFELSLIWILVIAG
ncbi:MAG: helix-turn-helix domain-containing protein, partial [Candidatus Omnitrophica bacterium]|nr:helix-turn-helix domain-containing protein [Candidatus Omnitrophota bacterium]